MTRGTDYFVNHGVGQRWPFSIYHRPVEDFLVDVARELPPGSRALNIGCGLFEMFPRVAHCAAWDACDIDGRCIDAVKRTFPAVAAAVCGALPEYPEHRFDLVVAKEVLEHITDSPRWLRRVFSLVKPGGRVVLTTPNYGVSLLPVVEYTLLEVLARARGFSRFGIHPNKYQRRKLLREVRDAAPPRSQVRVRKLSVGMVLVADARLATS